MGRTQDLRVVDPVLTNLVRGYSNAAFVGSVLFPVVTVFKEGGKIPTFGKEAFKEYSTERALRAKSNKMPVEARSTIDYILTEHDAVYPLDYREIAEDIFNARSFASYMAQSAILLKHERACADLATDESNYDGNSIVLSGSSQFTNESSDPVGVVRTACESVRQKIARLPNTMVMGAQSFNALQDHPAILERIKYSMKGIVTIDLLKAIFDIQNIAVANSVYVADNGQIKDNWEDNIILAYVPEAQTGIERSVFEPSFGYTLRKSGHPQVDTYMEEGGKIENIRSTDNLVVKIVGADAGYLIKDTNG